MFRDQVNGLKKDDMETPMDTYWMFIHFTVDLPHNSIDLGGAPRERAVEHARVLLPRQTPLAFNKIGILPEVSLKMSSGSPGLRPSGGATLTQSIPGLASRMDGPLFRCYSGSANKQSTIFSDSVMERGFRAQMVSCAFTA